MSWFIVQLISAFLLPPLNFFGLIALGFIGLKWFARLGRVLIITGFALMWVCFTPYCADSVLRMLEDKINILDDKSLKQAQAIVILGGGSYFSAPEYGYQDTVNDKTLMRLRYGAKLYHYTHLPVLVSGGVPLGNSISEALQMKSVLEQEFHIPVRWLEDKSVNTFENAHNSFELLQKTGIKKIYLVSHAWHLPRAIAAFENAGFTVIAAPTGFTTRYQTDLLAFIPNTGALENSKIFFHEIIGLIWYRLKMQMLHQS